MKKTILLLLAAALIMTAFTACGRTETAASSTTAATTITKTPETEAPARETTVDPKTITGSVMLYSSMKEDQLAAIKAGFNKKYPKISMDYYTAGTSAVMTKIATEEQAGRINADIMWVGDTTHYVDFKERGLLLEYESPEAANVPDMFKDKDNKYIGARIVTLGFVYNTTLVSEEEAPKTWEDLLLPKWKGKIVMTDPSFSGTTLSTVAGLVQNEKYGWEYIEALKANGMDLQQGSSAAVTTVGSGEYYIGVAADYIAETLESQGGTVNFVHPETHIPLVASPIAILKDTKNLEAVKLFYDFILSEEGQTILTESFTTPVRNGVSIEGAVPIDQIVARAAVVDEVKVINEKDEILNRFDSIFKK